MPQPIPALDLGPRCDPILLGDDWDALTFASLRRGFRAYLQRHPSHYAYRHQRCRSGQSECARFLFGRTDARRQHDWLIAHGFKNTLLLNGARSPGPDLAVRPRAHESLPCVWQPMQ